MLDRPGSQRDRLIRHELTHVAIGERDDDVPVWLSEGIAEYVSVRPLAPEDRLISGDALAAAEAGIRDLPADRTFNDGHSGANYGIAWWACQWIADSYGPTSLWSLLDAMHGTDESPDRVLTSLLGINSRTLARKAGKLIRLTFDPSSLPGYAPRSPQPGVREPGLIALTAGAGGSVFGQADPCTGPACLSQTRDNGPRHLHREARDMTGSSTIPQPGGPPFVTDGGLETDLIFHHGADLPEFAAFPLVEDDRGRGLLRAYFDGYAEVARRAGAGLLLEAPTWRANTDWGARIGYDPRALDRVNRASIEMLAELRESYHDLPDVLVGGVVGPRGDGYRAGERADPDEAAAYHRPQVEAFAAAGADLVSAYTLTGPEEAIGVVRAARGADLPVAVSFTVETDGRLPDGTPLAAAVELVDVEAGPDYFLVNCAHPTHMAPGLTDGAWLERIVGVLPNASTRTHAELDEAEELDEGDPAELAGSVGGLRPLLPNLAILGGCCGTDARHVAALWGVR